MTVEIHDELLWPELSCWWHRDNCDKLDDTTDLVMTGYFRVISFWSLAAPGDISQLQSDLSEPDTTRPPLHQHLSDQSWLQIQPRKQVKRFQRWEATSDDRSEQKCVWGARGAIPSSGADDSVWLCRTIPSGKHFSESPPSGDDDDDDDDDNCDDDGRIWQTHLRLRARNPSRRNQNGRAVMNIKKWLLKCWTVMIDIAYKKIKLNSK